MPVVDNCKADQIFSLRVGIKYFISHFRHEEILICEFQLSFLRDRVIKGHLCQIDILMRNSRIHFTIYSKYELLFNKIFQLMVALHNLLEIGQVQTVAPEKLKENINRLLGVFYGNFGSIWKNIEE